ncbi:Disulfide bond formation protein B [Crenothrix polyspora]|uniref:Disulfide bond formation protein B n=1 Tax=Crenothrix polyspora TaxID=360316 RepID=A0A1R4HA12_9GAMM|nr:disulfide bond formation protein B [Crenothrix polyspora]SJM93085.1 Disulfide bond formation protein B [Crenothrix polyspora]
MLNPLRFNPRTYFFIGFLICCSLLLIGAYLQFEKKLEPCPLCISQRIAIFATGLCFLCAAIHNPKQTGINVYAVVGAVTALCGAGVSMRHIWLQHLPPDQVPECSPGLEFVFQNFPLSNTLKLMLNGTGECAKVDWTLLGFSIPELTLLAFLSLVALSLAQIWNHPKQSSFY